MTDFQEKRKHPRILIKIKCKGEDKKYFSKDLSCEGIFLRKCNNFPNGSILCLEFKLPGKNKKIATRGIICWTNEEGAGIRFLTLSLKDFEQIRDFLNTKQ